MVILNTGNHWVLANIQYQSKFIQIWDSYAKQHRIQSLTDMIRLLHKEGWTVNITGVGIQKENDNNTCGFHVLQWIKQLAGQEYISATWKPTTYEAKEWIQKVYESLNFDIGTTKVRTNLNY